MRPVLAGPSRARSRRDTGFAVASCTFLAAYNNVIGAQSWHRRWYAPANACAAAAALAAAGASGLTAEEIGLGRGAWRPGRLASALAAATVGGYLAAAAMPVTRPLLEDKRVTTLDGPGLAYQVGDDVAGALRDSGGAEFIAPDGTGRYLADLAAMNVAQPELAGIPADKIEGPPAWTDGGSTFFSDRAQRPCGRFALVARLANVDS